MYQLSTLLLVVWGCFTSIGIAQEAQPESSVEQLEAGKALDRAKLALKRAYQHDLPAKERLVAAEEALEFLGPDGEPGLRSLGWSMVSWTHSRLGRSDFAREACERAVELGRVSEDRSRLHTAICARGALAFEAGDIESATVDFTEALRLAEELGNHDHVASALNNLGSMARTNGDYRQAADFYERALDAAVRARSPYLEASTANNLAVISLELDLPEEALARYQQTLDLAQRAGIASLQFVGRKGIASARLALGESEIAAGELRTLVREDTEAAEPKQLAAAFEALARAELAVGRPSAAVAASREAVSLYEDSDAITRRLRALDGLAQALAATGDFPRALDVIEEALENAVGKKNLHHTALRTKAALLTATGDRVQAYEVTREADQLREQLSEGSAKDKLALMRASLERANRERELTLLRERQAATEARARMDRSISIGVISISLLVLTTGFLLRRSRVRRLAAEGENASARELLARDAVLKSELERLVNLRSDELQHEVHERRALEERIQHDRKLEAIGKLTGGIAHDFNNLMTVVLSSMDLLRTEGGESLSTEQMSLIEDAAKAARTGAKITQRLLAFSRQQALQPTIVHVADFLAGVEGLIRRTLGDGVTLEIRCDTPELAVLADADQLTTALINLAANARDSMDERGKLTIWATRRFVETDEIPDLQASNYAAIIVTDTGKGMSSEELAQACEPFYSTKEFSAGSGLGLSMVFGFTRQSGGGIQLESAPGRGTSAILLIPECRDDLEHSAQVETEDARFDGMRALVVEDRLEVRKIMRHLLAHMGFVVDVAESADAACLMVRGGSAPDFVLSDVVMPGRMSGIDLAQWFENHYPEVRVLLTSGYVDSNQTATPRSQILLKPFTSEQLNAAVCAAFGNQAACTDRNR